MEKINLLHKTKHEFTSTLRFCIKLFNLKEIVCFCYLLDGFYYVEPFGAYSCWQQHCSEIE